MRVIPLTLVLHKSVKDWSSWEEKIEAVQAFWSPVCQFDIKVDTCDLNPTFQEHTKGENQYMIDLGWYDVNISSKYKNSGTVCFVIDWDLVPRPKGYGIGGVMTYNYPYPNLWEIQVFGKENEQAYFNGKSLGDLTVLRINHEISHRLYAEKGGPDLTHPHFLDEGSPEAVYADLRDFLAKDDTLLISLYKQLLGLLIKQKQMIIDEQQHMSKSDHLYDIAYSFIGKDASPDDEAPDEKGCAESLSKVIQKAFPELKFPTFLSTRELFDYFERSTSFTPTNTPHKGDIIISVTGTGNGIVKNGHCGIIGKNLSPDGSLWIMSNDSYRKVWLPNLTQKAWDDYYRTKGGMETFHFTLGSN